VESTAAGAAVELHGGARIEAETVVVAAGHLSGHLLPQLADIVFPIKGEAFDIRRPDAITYPLGHHVFAEIDGGDGQRGYPYLVPRHDGRMAVGVTYEERVDDPTPTAKGLAEIRNWMAVLMPEAANWPVEHHWGGLRPASPDHIPIIGYVDDHERLLSATGHSGLGVTLAPVTAELVSAVLTGQDDEETLDRLRICRPDRTFEAATPVPTPAPTTP
jgi:glycine oxidase